MPINLPADNSTSWGSDVRAAITAVNGLEGTTTANLPETIRDTIGATVVGSGLVTVTPNDVADTVTVATSATANSPDAALLARANHTGTQTAVTISDLAEAVDDRVAALLTAGSNITLTYNDALGTLTIAASGAGGGLDTEAVQDTIGSTVVGTGLITATYNDTAGTHTIATTATAWDAEQTRDTIATALVAGTNVTITPNDGADTITIAAAGASGINPTIVDAKGDLIAATAADAVARLAVGTNGSVLTAASGQTTGLSWTAGTQVHAVGNSGTALTLNASSTSGYIKTITLTGNCTFTLTGATSGLAAALKLVLTQDATGGRTVTWPTSVKWVGGVAPMLSITAGATDRVDLTSYDGGTSWYGELIGNAYAAEGATLLFQSSFEAGNFTDFNSCQWTGRNDDCNTYNGTSDYSATVVAVDGRPHVARFEVRDGDVPPFGGGERAEIGAPGLAAWTDLHAFPGDERWIAFDMKLDSAFPNPGGWGGVLWQWHQSSSTEGSPALALDISPSGTLGLANHDPSAPTRTDIGAAAKGVWQRFVIHTLFSDNAAVGFREMWINGAQVVPKTFCATMRPAETYCYMKMGHYRDNPSTGTAILYFDNLRITGP
jgi:hypothetical protein